ncbi:MAG: glycosyltransferase family 4 protein [Candidatus Schekmanbacteria bacterium]|nr:glycosyltransferase family 4 protein [Candidatus Schekmanbacteria bacterium]
MRRILYLTPSVSLYGARRVLLSLIDYLPRDVFDPVVVGPGDGPLIAELQRRGIRSHIVRIDAVRKAKNLPMLIPNLWRLSRIARREQVTLIHVNDFWANPWALLPARRRHLPIVCHVHNDPGAERIRKYFLGRADRLIAVSDAVATAFAAAPECRVSVIRSGVDLEPFLAASQRPSRFRAGLGLPPDALIVGMAAHVSRRKNQGLLLAALRHVISHQSRVHGVLVGGIQDEEYARELRSLAEAPPLRGHIHFVDFQDDMPDVTAGFDIAALTSVDEGLGLVSVEAMACGRPVVATAVGGIPEVVSPGKTGFLHAPGDVAGLAESLVRLAVSPALRRELGEEGRRRSALFAARPMAAAVLAMYCDLLRIPLVAPATPARLSSATAPDPECEALAGELTAPR